MDMKARRQAEMIAYGKARKLGQKTYFVGIPCMNGHVADRYVSDGRCVECNRARGRIANMTPEQVERSRVQRRVANLSPEQVERLRAKARIENMTPDQAAKKRASGMTPEQLERRRANDRARYHADPAKAARQWNEWYERNRGAYNASVAEYKADMRSLTPDWANHDAIHAVYKLSAQLTAESGVVHHVDHIVALRCKEASGLHVETNLRVIPGADNLSKNAKLDHALAINPNPPQCTLASCRCGLRAKLLTPLLAA